MKFLVTLASVLTLNLGFSQEIQYPLIKADKGYSLNSLRYSASNDLLFATAYPMLSNKDQHGYMYVLNWYDSLIKKISFPAGGNVCLDERGLIGTFIGNDNTIRFFDQKTLALIDSVNIPNLRGTKLVWFTEGGIIIGGIDSNYKYDLKSRKLSEIVELKSYRIFDYDLYSDLLLIGYWDESLSLDVKIKTQFLSFSTNPAKKKLLFKTEGSIFGSFFMGNASRVICQDVHKVYSYDITNKEFKSPIQEGLVSLNKSDEEMVVLCVRGNLIYWNSSSGVISKTFIPKYGWIFSSSYLVSPSRKYSYYLSVGLENSIIALR
jgi:hypothetical protein